MCPTSRRASRRRRFLFLFPTPPPNRRARVFSYHATCSDRAASDRSNSTLVRDLTKQSGTTCEYPSTAGEPHSRGRAGGVDSTSAMSTFLISTSTPPVGSSLGPSKSAGGPTSTAYRHPRHRPGKALVRVCRFSQHCPTFAAAFRVTAEDPNVTPSFERQRSASRGVSTL